MPAYFYFAGSFSEEFKFTHLAFKALMHRKASTIHELFSFPSLPNLPNQNTPGPLILSLGSSAILMCGTTAELTVALAAERANNLAAFTVAGVEGLCVHFARVKYARSSTLRTVLCLASWQGWWHVDDFDKAGRPEAYDSFLPTSNDLKQKYKPARIDWRSLTDRPVPSGITTPFLENLLIKADRVEHAWINVDS